MWSCVITDIAHAQRSYLTVALLTFVEWRSAFTETEKNQDGWFLRLLLSLLLSSIWKGVTRVGKESPEQEEDIIIWIMWLKIFSPAPSFKQYRNY